jgi:hypothetical protein
LTEDSMTSAMCLVNRHAACHGQVLSLVYTGPCTCPVCHVDPDPEPDDQEEAADRLADQLLEREAEDRMFGAVA